MDLSASELIVHLYLNVDVFMAVFVRIMGFFIILPVLSGQSIPLQARLILSLGVAILAFVGDFVVLPPYDPTIFGFGVLIFQEFMVGLIIGLVVMMVFSMFHFVGQLIDFQMGFGMVTVFDPFGMQQTPITGNFYFLIISLFFVSTGALQYVLGIFYQSFELIGLGQGQVLGNRIIAVEIVEIIVQYFHLGLRIALPVVGTIIIVDIVLGILVKAVPQMNVFVVGLPIKVALGLIIIFLTMPFLSDAFALIMDDVVRGIANIIRGMMPE
ncbi:MAG: flagellar biosynthetic protein FliR [Clostridiales bacterium]|nr:flagellar biosynthetic protein FliR [Clostridiales bacterium]